MSVRRSAAAFTLIEVLAVMLLTSLVLTACVNFYLQLSRSSARAADLTRDGRRAVALLDRVARDLEGSTLIQKPDDVDPIRFPWLFLAESVGQGDGADRLKFMTRSHVPHTDDPSETDLQVVTWMAEPGAEGDLVLRRAASNALPQELDRSYPPEEDQMVVARGLARFAVRLLDDTGEWKSAWDSSTVVDSSKLPIAAEIEIAFVPPDAGAVAGEVAEPTPYLRRVALPLRPIDLEALLSPDGEKSEEKKDGEEEDEDDAQSGGLTVSECLAKSPALAAALADLDPSVLESVASQSAASVAASRGVPLPAECQ